jgi:hypothetical protein
MYVHKSLIDRWKQWRIDGPIWQRATLGGVIVGVMGGGIILLSSREMSLGIISMIIIAVVVGVAAGINTHRLEKGSATSRRKRPWS